MKTSASPAVIPSTTKYGRISSLRTFRFGFFRASRPVGDEICKKLIDFSQTPRPFDETRTAKIDEDTPMLLRNILNETDGTFLLDFTRIRDIPSQPLSDLAGNEDKIIFHGKKHRPAEYTCGAFDLMSRVLVLQEHSYGVTPSMVVKYWRHMIPGLGKFTFDPIMKGSARDQLMKAGAISKFTVKLASMGDPKLIKSLGLAEDDVLDLIGFYSSPTISVTLQLDPKQPSKSLNGPRIKALAAALLPLPKNKLKKLSLVAEDDAGEVLPIDLLKDRIVHKEPCYVGEQEEMTDELRYNAVRSAWNQHGSELRARYENAD